MDELKPVDVSALASGVAGSADCGIKQELKVTVNPVTDETKKLSWLSFGAHEEVKSGCEVPPSWTADSYTSDLLAHGIFKKETAISAIKAVWGALTVPTTTFGKLIVSGGYMDQGRDLTTNALAALGLKIANNWSRTPTINPAIERPENHIFPGSTLGAYLLWGQSLDEKHKWGWSFFFGDTSARKSSGVTGFKVTPPPADDENARASISSIAPFSDDPSTRKFDDPMFYGNFLTTGAGLAYGKTENVHFGANVSYSRKMTPAADKNSDPTVQNTVQNMYFVQTGLEYRRFSGFADVSVVTQKETPTSVSFRAGVEQRVAETKDKKVGVDVSGSIVYVNTPTKTSVEGTTTNSVPCTDENGVVLADKHDCTEEVANGVLTDEITPRNGLSAMAGVSVEYKPASAVTIFLGAGGGVVTDTNPILPDQEHTEILAWTVRGGVKVSF